MIADISENKTDFPEDQNPQKDGMSQKNTGSPSEHQEKSVPEEDIPVSIPSSSEKAKQSENDSSGGKFHTITGPIHITRDLAIPPHPQVQQVIIQEQITPSSPHISVQQIAQPPEDVRMVGEIPLPDSTPTQSDSASTNHTSANSMLAEPVLAETEKTDSDNIQKKEKASWIPDYSLVSIPDSEPSVTEETAQIFNADSSSPPVLQNLQKSFTLEISPDDSDENKRLGKECPDLRKPWDETPETDSGISEEAILEDEHASEEIEIHEELGFITNLGLQIENWLCALGDFSLFAFRMMWWLCRFPRRGTLLPCLYEIGVMSLPVIALTGTFIGMVLAVQSFYQLKGFYLETRIGALINISLVRELGPVLAATMLAGRIGSSMAAELGTMRVTEQIDALSSMGVNPVHYLVVPRFLGCVMLIPVLTIVADFMGIVGGAYFSVWIYKIDWHFYLANSNKIVGLFDVFSGIFKSLFFGAAIGLIGCHRGFNSRAGAEGVGKAATEAFVFSFVTILLLDLVLGIFLEFIAAFIPQGPRVL